MTSDRSTPRLQDVAQRAGVSTATVSRCLNAPEKVVEKTREKVMRAVRDLGYSPNFGARAMAAKRTFTIGAVIPTMENAIFARGLQAFQEELRQHGYHLLVASSSYNTDLEQEQVHALVARGAEGLLLIGHDRAQRTETFLRQRGLPVIVAWSYEAQSVFPSVGFDNRAAMRTIAERVLQLGHRDIGVISAPTSDNDRARARVAGIRDALGCFGLPESSAQVIETSYGIETGSTALRALLAADKRLTAVICGNDVLAAGALRAARQLALDVPGDLSITGFDDLELASATSPELTTMRVPHKTMGQTAARMLIGMIEDASPPRSVRLEPRLMMRETLGAPRRAAP